MGEGPWDPWKGTDSLLKRLIDGKSARLEGTGVLELQEEEDSWKSGAHEAPGQVNFVLLCDFEEFKSPYAEAIKVRLVSRDDAAFRILRGKGDDRRFRPLPWYRLSGSTLGDQGEIPVQMEAVLIDDRAPTLLGIPEKKKEVRQVAPVGSVTVGPLKSMKELVICKVVMPNFVDEVTLEDRGVRVALSPISPEVTQSMYASESQGKILPGSYLEVQRLQEDAGESVELAVNDVGWLISFYAGRRTHPIAWEGETGRGTVWHIQNRQLITPLSENYANSCVSNVVPLEHFLQHAWRAWQIHNEQRRARLRGAVNFYADILSVTFSTQSLALTTMYLERFRHLMLGNSAVLQVINEDQEKIDANSMAKSVRSTLRTIVEHNENLTADEQRKLTQAINKIGPGTMEGLFRKTLRESILELYERANLEVDPGELGRFIRERDKVIHGSWDSGRGEALETYRLAQYGLSLLEMLLLRLFEYEGPYFNRASFSTQIFPSGIASWQ